MSLYIDNIIYITCADGVTSQLKSGGSWMIGSSQENPKASEEFLRASGNLDLSLHFNEGAFELSTGPERNRSCKLTAPVRRSFKRVATGGVETGRNELRRGTTPSYPSK